MGTTVQQLLAARATDDGVAVKYISALQSWRDHIAEASSTAAVMLDIMSRFRPQHVATLLGNTPDMLVHMAAAGLGGYTLCGLNTTRRGQALLRDIRRADCQVVVVDAAHRSLLDGLDLGSVSVIETATPRWARLLASRPSLVPSRIPTPSDTFMLIFTSGTGGDPKAVEVSHYMVEMAGQALVERFSITSADTCYLPMPLFHSLALVGGWAVAISSGAAMVPAAFSASHFLSDIRGYNATYTNYVGKALAYILATPEQAGDAANPLRVAFGNEASDRDIAEFSRRFGAEVWDGFGSTENAVIVTREPGTPPGSIGKGFDGVAIYNSDTGRQCPIARFGRHGELINAEEAIGGWSTRKDPECSRGTTKTRTPLRPGCAAVCTGRATSHTATPTDGYTWPAGRPTGCASMAKTSPPCPSSGSCCATMQSVVLPCMPFPTRSSAML